MINADLVRTKKGYTWLVDIFLIIVLLGAATLRLTGSDWGQLNIQHPDEDFMTSVTRAVQPVHNLAEYFNTAQSTLNPSVVGYPAYVYGTLPLYIVHGLAQVFGKLDTLTLFGRQLSAVADLGTISLLYFIVRRFYKARVALLAAAFSALTVMQIQQSHFYTSDNFSTFFMFLTLAVAAVIATGNWQRWSVQPGPGSGGGSVGFHFLESLLRLFRDPLTYSSIAFGFALGMATASKLNAAAMAMVLPIALVVRYFKLRPRDSSLPSDAGVEREEPRQVEDFIARAFVFLVIGALFSLIAFRVFQPYAFSGPGFFNLKLNSEWVQKVHEQLLQASPNTDLPWALQWARRSHLYSGQNLTVWGLGLPLGLLAWAGFLWMGWRMLKGEWRQHILLWSWTAIYFVWQSLQYNPTMRYQLPVYPLLGMMAAWLINWLWDKGRRKTDSGKWSIVYRLSSLVVGVVILFLTAAYAYAFSRIYVRPETRIAASEWIYQNIPGPINLYIQTSTGSINQQPLPFYSGVTIQSGTPYQTAFVPTSEGLLNSILLAHVTDFADSGSQTLRVILSNIPDAQPDQVLADLSVTAGFAPKGDPRGDPVALKLDHPVPLQRDTTYYLKIQTTGGIIVLYGATVANETDYDWSLPFRMASYDPFGGIYRGDLNLQVYWDDNADKLARFQSVLDQTDYIFIPTNHQYAQITRLPERYPLTTEYYRQLIGCPPDKNIIWCYRVAEPGMFHGSLGFEMVATFKSYPTIGLLVINDQSAEEAFTFYDHPKVLIFKKSAAYIPAAVQSVLGKVDYSKAVHLTPGQADTYKSLLLPSDQLVIQQSGGTWSDLYNYSALLNRYPLLGLVVWYGLIFMLGLVVYPLVRAAFPGLADHGYPLARIIGLLLWAWLAWMGASLGLSYSKLTIGIALAVVVLIGLWQGWRQRRELLVEIRTRWKYFLMVEGIFLGFFLLDLLIRIGNPDLWHPSKGGERPMEFAFFNAILKSTTFPPYDPWFAGGYINYYYYGYVIIGTPVKLLGIVPSIAFNFILPTLFACLAVSAFSFGWNILNGIQAAIAPDKDSWDNRLIGSRFVGGITASAAMVIVGNLGILHLLNQGFQRLAAPGGIVGGANIFQRTWWAIKGLFLVLGGLNLPYGPGDWYWFSSRIFPPSYGDFYEFPVFTFIWSDLHAHVIALMLTVLVITWALSVLLSKARWNNPTNAVLGFFLGGLIIGSLRPTNTWDFYTYLPLGAVVLGYTVWRYSNPDTIHWQLPGWVKRFIITTGALAALAGLSILLYQPFSHWFGQAYNSVEKWTGARTPISTWLTQWGVFLFFIISWMTWETRQWLADTPLSSLHKLRPYRDLIIAGLVIFLLALVGQQAWVMSSSQNIPWKGITILWIALPLAVWAAILLFRPGLSNHKQLILFMIGTGLLLTMMVELIVVTGDIGRFNTVFKFGIQCWILLGISAAAAFNWLLPEIRKWLPGWRVVWQGASILLVAGAMLVLVVAGAGKIRDRMTAGTPHMLDSMTYMAYAHYSEFGVDMDLSQDYRLIRWMQDNIQGSPVIVEAAPAGVQYAWLGRISIYTGLPAVIGWEWHEEQQRVLDTTTVVARGREVDDFYDTTDLAAAQAFLGKYNIHYIVVGQLERAKYAPGSPGGPIASGSPDGLLKFEANNNILWRAVYRDGQTVLYEVISTPQVNP